MTKTGDYAFSGCSELTDLYCSAVKAPAGFYDGQQNLFKDSYIEYATLHVPEESIETYKSQEPWSGFDKIVAIKPFHTLTYVIDGETYKTIEIEEGTDITALDEPIKEGYTFSGWSEIPETMPAEDVTVTGTFTINKYNLTYMLDGEVYKTNEVEYGASITPEADPAKEGYTFAGWTEIPETMPAKDVTVTGTFKYTLTYEIDGETVKTSKVNYGRTITAYDKPQKEGYTFVASDEEPKTMPANDVTIKGYFTVNKYNLTYVVDGVTYKTSEVEYGTALTAEAEPTKEGYTFSGWSEIPETMPAEDVTVKGTFSLGKYTISYEVDGEVVKSSELAYGAQILPIYNPTKEGYTFVPSEELPATMPGYNVTITGTFVANEYTLTYIVGGTIVSKYTIEYGQTIEPEEEPTKEGYTFSGWSDIPETMPAKNVTIRGSFTVNSYKLTYMLDGEVYKTFEVVYGTSITPEAEPVKDGYTFDGWSEIPETMPANDVTITGTFTYVDAIADVKATESDYQIYTLDGKAVGKLQKGLNIIRYKNGSVKKVFVK